MTSDLLPLLAAVVGALALAALVGWIVSRRTAQAVAVARAEGGAARAAVEERLRGREETLAEARRELQEAAARAAALAGEASDLRARLAAAEARLAEEREHSGAKTALLDEARQRLSDAFAHLAGQALATNNDSFLSLAEQRFATLQAAAAGDLDQRRQAIDAALAPLREQLGRYETAVRDLEQRRESAYGGLSEQIRGLLTSQERLQSETGNLVKALRAPQVRGRWGEMQLKRAVEFAGLVDHVDFLEQETAATDDTTLRPDMVVKLPGGKQLVVDAKAPLAAYLDAVEARDEDQRRRHLVDHARQVRDHIKKLAAKSYWNQFENAPEFVVLYLPGETFFSAALEQDPSLIDEAFSQNVVLATPTTLVALLKSVAYGWRQEALATNARQISDAARELYDRLRVFSEHFARVGKGIEGALEAYNKAVGSFQLQLLPQGRRLERLGAAGSKPMALLEPIDKTSRALSAPELLAAVEPAEEEP